MPPSARVPATTPLRLRGTTQATNLKAAQLNLLSPRVETAHSQAEPIPLQSDRAKGAPEGPAHRPPAAVVCRRFCRALDTVRLSWMSVLAAWLSSELSESSM